MHTDHLLTSGRHKAIMNKYTCGIESVYILGEVYPQCLRQAHDQKSRFTHASPPATSAPRRVQDGPRQGRFATGAEMTWLGQNSTTFLPTAMTLQKKTSWRSVQCERAGSVGGGIMEWID